MKKILAYPFVALTAFLLLFVGFQLGAFQLAVSSASVSFGLDKSGMGTLISVQYASMIVVPILFGLLADRVGKKPIMIVGVLGIFGGCLAAGLSGSLYAYAAGIFFVGAGGIICESISSAAIADLYPSKSARFICLCQCAFSIGAIAGPIILQSAMDAGSSFKILYAIYGAAALVCLLPLLKTRIPKPKTLEQSTVGNPLRFLRSGPFVLLFMGIIFYVGLENGFGYFAETLFDLRLSQARMGAFAISAFWVGVSVSRLVSGISSLPAKKIVPLYFCLSAVALTALALSQSALLSVAISALVGFGYGPLWSSLVALAASEFPDHSAGAVGVMSTGCGIGGVIYPIVMGFMADNMDIQIPFFLLAATAFVGGLLGLIYLRGKGKKA